MSDPGNDREALLELLTETARRFEDRGLLSLSELLERTAHELKVVDEQFRRLFLELAGGDE